MGVDDKDTIDGLAIEKSNGAAVLVMSESRPSDLQANMLSEFEAKVNTYLGFILGGQMAGMCSLAGREARIELHCQYAPPIEVLRIYRLVRDHLKHKDVGFTTYFGAGQSLPWIWISLTEAIDCIAFSVLRVKYLRSPEEGMRREDGTGFSYDPFCDPRSGTIARLHADVVELADVELVVVGRGRCQADVDTGVHCDALGGADLGPGGPVGRAIGSEGIADPRKANPVGIPHPRSVRRARGTTCGGAVLEDRAVDRAGAHRHQHIGAAGGQVAADHHAGQGVMIRGGIARVAQHACRDGTIASEGRIGEAELVGSAGDPSPTAGDFPTAGRGRSGRPGRPRRADVLGAPATGQTRGIVDIAVENAPAVGANVQSAVDSRIALNNGNRAVLVRRSEMVTHVAPWSSERKKPLRPLTVPAT